MSSSLCVIPRKTSRVVRLPRRRNGARMRRPANPRSHGGITCSAKYRPIHLFDAAVAKR
jgi:hypothetical protein